MTLVWNAEVETFEPQGSAQVILADPPWKYGNFRKSVNGAAVAHYGTMSVEDICAIPVAKWCAPDAFLVLWGTWPQVPEALRVMEAWGFEHITGFPWIKTSPSSQEIYTGIGFWFQSASEYVLIGRRGNARRLPNTEKVYYRGLLVGEESQFYAPRTKHSQKPVEIHEWAEKVLPGGPRLELFARRECPGWLTWGLELGVLLTPEGIKRPTPDLVAVSALGY
jgi:N6-adenosine-specific RNA methylase IME4